MKKQPWEKMNNGFIYPIAKYLIEGLDKLNIVELFKFIARGISPEEDATKKRVYARIAIDIFMILKWLFILYIFIFSISNIYLTIIVWYLVISNLYTYFYRHVWCDDSFDSTHLTMERIRSRFLNMLLAFSYSEIAFAYLFYIPYAKNMSWGVEYYPTKLHALWFSISNSVAANYAVVAPISNTGNTVAIIQLCITFIFVTIIISRSIPQTN